MQDAMALGRDFEPGTAEDWKGLVEMVLRGGDFDKKLVSKTYDEIAIQPLYTDAHWRHAGDPAGFPGSAPFRRGAHALGTSGGWDIRQSFAHPDPKQTNQDILTDLERGVTSIQLKTQWPADDPNGGVTVTSVTMLEEILNDVYLDLAPLSLDASAHEFAMAAMVRALWHRRGLSGEVVRGALNLDPIGKSAFLDTGPGAKDTLDRRVALAASMAADTARAYPHVTSMSVDTRPYHGAGASEAQELAAALATGVAYLRALTAHGLDIETAARQLSFTLVTDADFLLSIAKLRAMRALWSQVVEACGGGESAQNLTLHAETATRMMTRRDPWVNMLRTTVAGFAAALGGADAITILPFSHALGQPDGFARRIARNTHIVLMEEASVARVIDPAGGAWALESLTDDLAAKAWALFQTLEAQGGAVQAVQTGRLQAMIAETAAIRQRNIARRKDAITGVSEFPELDGAPVAVANVDLEAIWKRFDYAPPIGPRQNEAHMRADRHPEPAVKADTDPQTAVALLLEKAANPTQATTPLDFEIEGLDESVPETPTTPRLAADFEALRDASDAWRAAYGSFPKIALITLGRIADYTARATFARSFYAAGGIEAHDPGPLDTPEAAVTAMRDSGARIAVLCSNDDVYAEKAEAVARALKAAGTERVSLAGRPGEHETAWTAAGIDSFIFTGSNTLAELKEVHAALGLQNAGAGQ